MWEVEISGRSLEVREMIGAERGKDEEEQTGSSRLVVPRGREVRLFEGVEVR